MPEVTRRRRALLFAAGGLPVVLGVSLIITAALMFTDRGTGSSRPDDTEVAAAMRKAGCTLRAFPAQKARPHLTSIDAHPKYNSFPPTSGLHYFAPVEWGFYPAPLIEIQAVHNLEHGGIVIQFGDQVDDRTFGDLVRLYREDRALLLVAPLPKLGKTLALTAWTVPPRKAHERPAAGTGHLARCTRFTHDAMRAFVDAYRGRGPESPP